MTKKEIRNKVIRDLNTINQERYIDRSKKIIDHLLGQEDFQNAQTIGITISRFPEVDTKTFIESAWKLGKKIAIPKCLPSTREMDFRIFSSYDELETVYMGLLEPIIEKTTAIQKDDIDLLVVPGVVYSKEGYRIGFGGGYYDRYLSDYKGDSISLAFTEQIKENILIESHDIPVQKIITDKQIINCQKE